VEKFTYPFRYSPHPLVRRAAEQLIVHIDSTPLLKSALSEGKMLGVLVCRGGETLFAFSGLAGGRSVLDGFVPPILDWAAPDGYFRRNEAEIVGITKAIGAEPDQAEKNRLAAMRKQRSEDLQKWLFNNYVVHNALGEEGTVASVFAERGLVPPGGTGDCAAPKLLEAAYRAGLQPMAMGEFWYGASPASEVRQQGCFYPSCTGKCGPLLTWMMRGLDVEPDPMDATYLRAGEPEIVFVDDYIIVARKGSGMLSVPGRSGAKSLLEWLRERFPFVESCHRLDMDTSGLMVFARTMEAKKHLEAQFAAGEVKKAYRARLVAGSSPFRRPLKGTIALPLSPDYYDRPRQIVDREGGKRAITEYEVLNILPSGEIDVIFRPLTGRTHQLRVHAAHPDGLAHPIKGDYLYGAPYGDRLYLDACYLAFHHPESGDVVEFDQRR